MRATTTEGEIDYSFCCLLVSNYICFLCFLMQSLSLFTDRMLSSTCPCCSVAPDVMLTHPPNSNEVEPAAVKDGAKDGASVATSTRLALALVLLASALLV